MMLVHIRSGSCSTTIGLQLVMVRAETGRASEMPCSLILLRAATVLIREKARPVGPVRTNWFSKKFYYENPEKLKKSL